MGKLTLAVLFLVIGSLVSGQDKCIFSQDKIYNSLSARQCDSLIKANATNPNFAILDVRTPGEYLPKHIEGAINRNANSASFENQLDQLDKNKTWLLHCQSGARSANAFASMKTLGFREVYNMTGGLNSWNSASLPTTTGFAAKWAVYGCSFAGADTLKIAEKDTISIRITNAANDTLKIYSVSLSGSSYFTPLPFASVNLLGSQSDTVQVIFSSSTVRKDSVSVLFSTNLGNKEVKLVRSVVANTGIETLAFSQIEIFPNPASQRVYLRNYSDNRQTLFRIFGLDGKPVKEGRVESNSVDISMLKNGIYLIRFEADGKVFTRKLIKSSR
jgi:rhodanese-related sulfurtransferase